MQRFDVFCIYIKKILYFCDKYFMCNFTTLCIWIIKDRTAPFEMAPGSHAKAGTAKYMPLQIIC